MTTERTLGLIKPDAVGRGLAGTIIERYEKEGFRLLGLQLLQLSREQAEAFYAVHRERPFFASLTTYISSGPVVALALERQNAVGHLRSIMGATDPEAAAEGTIRARFGECVERNCVHGSDSAENAALELRFFFAERDFMARS